MERRKAMNALMQDTMKAPYVKSSANCENTEHTEVRKMAGSMSRVSLLLVYVVASM